MLRPNLLLGDDNATIVTTAHVLENTTAEVMPMKPKNAALFGQSSAPVARRVDTTESSMLAETNDDVGLLIYRCAAIDDRNIIYYTAECRNSINLEYMPNESIVRSAATAEPVWLLKCNYHN